MRELPKNAVELPKLAYIDALRGLAIIGVIMVHTIEIVPPKTPLLLGFARAGTRGVQLFFIVSAVTLFLSMASRSKQEAAPYRNFFLRRLFRIAPLFTCAIVLYPLIKGTGPFYFAPNGVKWWYFPLTATYTHGWMPETINCIVPGGWSIAVEMTFYLFVPLLFVLISNLRRAVGFLIITLAIRIAANMIAISAWRTYYSGTQAYIVGDFAYFWFFNQLPVFAIGFCTYHLIMRFGEPSKVCGLVLLGIGILTYFVMTVAKPEFYLAPGHVIQSVSFAFIVIALALYPALILVNRFTCWIGRLSYSMYLTHFAVIGASSRLMHYFVGGVLPRESDLAFGALLALFVVMTAGIASLTYACIERPGIALGKEIIRQLELFQARPLSPSPAYEFSQSNTEA